MKAPVEWLKDYVSARLTAEQLAERLTMAGLEVTGIERLDGEPVFNLEITPNRADCLSIIGIAREVAAITGARLKLPRAVEGSGLKVQGKRHLPRTSNLEPRTSLSIRIEDRAGCLRYIGRLLEGVKIGPSPAWMQKRLMACGLRPINNVVDITNYVLLETGQPLHAFDYDRLTEGTIVVRRGRRTELLPTIDKGVCVISEDALVIADAKKPVALAGVMGGSETEIAQWTKRVLLESAWFDPIVVRRMSRRFRLSSESSYRFERGIDPRGVEFASQRAVALIVQLAGGRQTARKDVGTRAARPVVVQLEAKRLDQWLGAPIEPTKVSQILTRLGCSVKRTGGRWRVGVASFRRDLKQDVDVIEEIARLHGYDRLPATAPTTSFKTGHDIGSQRYARVESLRRLCASLGLWEIMTWALVSEAGLSQVGALPSNGGWLRLANPLSQDHAILRPTLLFGMLRAVSKNLAQGAHGARLFELGNVFAARPHPGEALTIGIGIAGLWQHSWQGSCASDLFVLKGLIEQLVERIARRPLTSTVSLVDWAEPGQGMQLSLNGRPLGHAGQVARRICEAFDCVEPVWFAELAVDALLGQAPLTIRTTSPSAFPPVKRDLSFVVERGVEFVKLLELIQAVGAPLASHVELIDRYTDSPQIPKTHHSLTFSIEYRDPSRTLTAAEVDEVHRRIGQTLVERFSAQLR